MCYGKYRHSQWPNTDVNWHNFPEHISFRVLHKLPTYFGKNTVGGCLEG